MPLVPDTWLDTQLVTNSASSADDTQITALSNGNFLVSWSQFLGGSGDGQVQQFGQIYNPEGTKIGNAFTLHNLVQEEYYLNARVDAWGDGGFQVSYNTYDTTSGSDVFQVRVERYNADGTPINNNSLISSSTTNSFSNEMTATNGVGSLVVYQVGDALKYKTFNGTGFSPLVGSESNFLSADYISTAGADIGVLSNGNYILVGARDSNNDFNADKITFSVISGNGTVLDPLNDVAATIGTSTLVSDVSVATKPDGTFIIAWREFDPSLITPNKFQIKFATYFNNGSTSVSSVVAVGGASDGDDTSLVGLDDGTFALFTNVGNSIVVTRYNSNGSVASATKTLATDGEATNLDAKLTVDGRMLVTWQQGANVEFQILDTRDFANGNLLFNDEVPTVGTVDADTFFVTAAEVYGHKGADVITETADAHWAGFSTVYGGQGSDTISVTGIESGDAFYGGQGFDTLVANGISNGTVFDMQFGTMTQGGVTQIAALFEAIVVGGTNDFIYGNFFGDSISGNGGNDFLNGRDGTDTLYGGNGIDTFQISNGDAIDHIYGGSGLGDILDLSGWSAGNDFEIDLLNQEYSLNFGATHILSSIGNVYGGAGEDSVFGNAAPNTFYGNAGNDSLIMREGDDVSFGGSGDDFISGSDGFDTLYGGSNADDIYGGDDADTVEGGQGNDTVNGDAGNDTVTGGIGNDTLFGGGDDDDLFDDNGSNTMYGGGGNDTLSGNSSNDKMYGDGDNDYLSSRDGNDELYGGAGSDTVAGDGNNDTLHGDGGDDSVLGGSGTDSLFGGSNNDNLFGGSGNDTLNGDGGNDTLDGGTGLDTLIGGAGDDVYVNVEEDDIIVENNGGGTDELRMDRTTTLGAHFENLSLTGSSKINGTGNDEDNEITGNSGNNALRGQSGSDVLNGADGKDKLFGGADSDTLKGGDGNDILNGGGGSDSMAGGDGNDTYIVDKSNDIVNEGSNKGTDTVKAKVDFTLGSHVENLTLTGKSNLSGEGNDEDNTIKGNSGKNILTGEGGKDIIKGGSGSDTLYGGSGNDTLDGGKGADVMFGGGGDDTFIVDNSGDVVNSTSDDTVELFTSYEMTSVAREVRLKGSSDIDATLFGSSGDLSGNEGDNVLNGNGTDGFVYGGGGDDVLRDGQFLLAGNGDDTLTGSDATTQLHGDDGDDKITGGDNDEQLYGGAGEDNLKGGKGKDTIFGDISGGTQSRDTIDGGKGNDELYGGGKADTFVMRFGMGKDVIKDFKWGTDVLSFVGSSQDGIQSSETNSGHRKLTLTDGSTVVLEGVAANYDPTGSASITGNAELDGTIKAKTSDISDADGVGSFSYQWLRNGNEISGAKNKTYDVQAKDVGKNITVRIEYTDDFGTEESVTSSSITPGNPYIGDNSANTITGNNSKNTMDGKGGNDTLNGLGGDDDINGGGGSDRVNGGKGADVIYGGGANDTLYGNDDSDFIFGDEGGDKIYGGGGSDNIRGGDGNDKLWGNSGSDTFIFAVGDDTDTIKDFGNGNDVIKIQSGASRFSQLDVSQVRDDVEITFSNVKIILENYDEADVQASMFEF